MRLTFEAFDKWAEAIYLPRPDRVARYMKMARIYMLAAQNLARRDLRQEGTS
jgi:hypothetical protein